MSRPPRRRFLDVKFPSSRLARRSDSDVLQSDSQDSSDVLENTGWPGSQPRREASDYYFLRTFVLHVAHCCFIFFFSSKERRAKKLWKIRKNIYMYMCIRFSVTFILSHNVSFIPFFSPRIFSSRFNIYDLMVETFL